MPIQLTSDEVPLSPVRTHVLRHTPERVWQILAGYRARGLLITPSWAIPVRQHANGEVTIRFEVREPAPPAAARISPVLRRVAYVAAALAALLLTGYLTAALFAAELAAALRLLGIGAAAAGTVLLVIARLGGAGRDRCPGAHCPSGRH